MGLKSATEQIRESGDMETGDVDAMNMKYKWGTIPNINFYYRTQVIKRA